MGAVTRGVDENVIKLVGQHTADRPPKVFLLLFVGPDQQFGAQESTDCIAINLAEGKDHAIGYMVQPNAAVRGLAPEASGISQWPVKRITETFTDS